MTRHDVIGWLRECSWSEQRRRGSVVRPRRDSESVHCQACLRLCLCALCLCLCVCVCLSLLPSRGLVRPLPHSPHANTSQCSASCSRKRFGLNCGVRKREKQRQGKRHRESRTEYLLRDFSERGRCVCAVTGKLTSATTNSWKRFSYLLLSVSLSVLLRASAFSPCAYTSLPTPKVKILIFSWNFFARDRVLSRQSNAPSEITRRSVGR